MIDGAGLGWGSASVGFSYIEGGISSTWGYGLWVIDCLHRS